MTKAVIVPFVQYSGTTSETSRLLFLFFLKHLKNWAKEIDHLYLVSSGDVINSSDQQALEKIVSTTIFYKPWQSHWQNLNETMSHITEDAFILMDSDTVIYRSGVISEIFKKLERNHVVSIMDNSGGDPLENNFPQLKPNIQRALRRRFAPYLFGCQTSFWKRLENPDFTPTQGNHWTDSMGTITRNILELKPTLEEIPDDRTTLYENNGVFTVTQWLDGGDYEWSKVINPDYGYYHLRNMGGALQAIQAFIDQSDHWKMAEKITPITELYRLLTWAQVVTGHNISFVPQGYKERHFEIYPWTKDLL